MALDPTQSILDSTKKVLGLDSEYDVYDADIVMHINSAFSTLNQLGIGPVEGFMIEDAGATWDAFLGPVVDPRFNSVKTYIHLKVRYVFDPPGNSFAMNAMKEQIQEYEWRLNVLRETLNWGTPVTVVTP